MTDDDAEMVMNAGSAAGLDVGIIHQRPHRRCPAGWTPWNPLQDDGDALRLAVDLGLNIEFGNDGESYSVAWDGCIGSGKFYHHESDRRNATRWAIVTVAAQADPKTPNMEVTGLGRNRSNDER